MIFLKQGVMFYRICDDIYIKDKKVRLNPLFQVIIERENAI